MFNQDQQKEIESITKDFFKKMTASPLAFTLKMSSREGKEETNPKESESVVEVSMSLADPQMYIGQNGQTLFEIERILRMMLAKKMNQNILLTLDINEYRKKKEEHLRSLARDLASEVAFTRERKALSPMSPFQRRIVHMELSQRQDVTTESQGEGEMRCVVIVPR